MARARRAVLVKCRYGELTAAIARDTDSGALWLIGDVSGGGGAGVSDYGPVVEPAPGGWVVGGALPPRASVASVRAAGIGWRDAATNGGAWICHVETDIHRPEFVVRYCSANGAIVRRPLPPGTEQRAVPEANERCPVCSAATWQLVKGSIPPLLPVRHPGAWSAPDARTLICDRCGHREHLGADLIARNDQPRERTRKDTARAVDAKRREHVQALKRASFPVYALGQRWTGARSLAGFGVSDGQVEFVVFEHLDPRLGRRVTVETASSPDDETLDDRTRLLEGYVQTAPDTDSALRTSEEARALSANARMRSLHAAAARLRPRRVDLTVDDIRLPFHVVGSKNRWVGLARHGELRLVVEAVGISHDDLELQRVDDPQRFLAPGLGDP